jgi:hypothetical protein
MINIITIVVLIVLLFRYLIIGFFPNCNLGNKLMANKINNIKKTHSIIDKKNYLKAIQKNSRISLILISICSFIILYFRSEYSSFVALIAILINLKLENKENSYLKLFAETKK